MPIHVLSALSAILLFLSATQEELYKAVDFSKEHEFTAGIEGPSVARDGSLYVMNLKNEGTVGRVKPDGTVELFVELPKGSIGNGSRFQSDGSMLVADYTGHNVLRLDMKTKAVSVWAHESRMNQPNDIAIMKNDTVFASDPNWSNSTGNLWRISPAGKVSLVEEKMGTTNGIEVSPDNRYLYVNESIQLKVWRYRLSAEGNLNHKQLIAEFPDFGLDGMRCDAQGNLYITRYGKGTMVKLSPEGKLLKEIQLKGKNPTNIAFGGKDGKTVFVTMQDRGMIEKFQVE